MAAADELSCTQTSPPYKKNLYETLFPYLGLTTSSMFTGVGSFVGFAGTPHFRGSEVELGPLLLPWLACVLFMLSTANISAAV